MTKQSKFTLRKFRINFRMSSLFRKKKANLLSCEVMEVYFCWYIETYLQYKAAMEDCEGGKQPTEGIISETASE